MATCRLSPRSPTTVLELHGELDVGCLSLDAVEQLERVLGEMTRRTHTEGAWALATDLLEAIADERSRR